MSVILIVGAISVALFVVYLKLEKDPGYTPKEIKKMLETEGKTVEQVAEDYALLMRSAYFLHNRNVDDLKRNLE